VVGYADRAFSQNVNNRVASPHTRFERADGEAVHPTMLNDFAVSQRFD
jgi:hypothetical protein